MTVQDLINELESIINKEKTVKFKDLRSKQEFYVDIVINDPHDPEVRLA